MSEVTQPDAADPTEDLDGTGKKPGQDQSIDSDKVVGDQDDGKPFDREYVEKLRKESQGYRERAKAAEANADKYAQALFAANVAATGRLADPTDLAYSAELVDDADALTAAIDALLAAKPHLASRKPAWGDVGAGRSTAASLPSFADLFHNG